VDVPSAAQEALIVAETDSDSDSTHDKMPVASMPQASLSVTTSQPGQPGLKEATSQPKHHSPADTDNPAAAATLQRIDTTLFPETESSASGEELRQVVTNYNQHPVSLQLYNVKPYKRLTPRQPP